MEQLGDNLEQLEPFGGNLEQLEQFEIIWDNSKQFGTVLSNLEQFGAIEAMWSNWHCDVWFRLSDYGSITTLTKLSLDLISSHFKK